MFIYMIILQVGWTKKTWRAKGAVRHIFTFKHFHLNIYSAISCLLEGFLEGSPISSFANAFGGIDLLQNVISSSPQGFIYINIYEAGMNGFEIFEPTVAR